MLITPPFKKAPWLVEFLSHCHTKRYEKRVDFIRQGMPAESLYFLVEGSVTAMIEDDERRELILAFINAGEFIGEMGLFHPQSTRNVIVRTREACKIAEISYNRAHQILAREMKEHAREFLTAVGGQLAQRLRRTSRQASDLVFMDVAGRIAAALLELCKQPDAMTHPDGMQIRITRQDIGRMVGCSREMAGRVLKSLEDDGHIEVSGKTIVVLGIR